MTSSTIPWVEKYRPSNFEDIVLDPKNRNIFENIIEKNYFPNLLFYGPPGTGKTTTIINLINAYQSKTEQVSKTTVIHLNASDERGIDIIRNQIYQFVRSNNLFEKGVKFVILDEVDYMTKNAQQALKYLLQSSHNVRFCLICNYISKIDESLKNEFISIRFNQLPPRDIHRFIRNVAQNEKIEMTDEMIYTIQSLYYSDIRSMINFIQLSMHQNNMQIITDVIYDKIWNMIYDQYISSNAIIRYIHKISIQYNTDKRNILKNCFNYLVRNFPAKITPGILIIGENLIHIYDANIEDSILYFICHIRKDLS
jgi:replication factor C subunit 3/5